MMGTAIVTTPIILALAQPKKQAKKTKRLIEAAFKKGK